MHVVIAGGSGFIGTSLSKHLTARGDQVTILTRGAGQSHHGCTLVQWDARSHGEWANCLEGADALVNLVGRTVDCKKTPDHCDEILRSRVESTRVLGKAMQHLENPPPVWAQMSTAHIYGDPPQLWCDERSPYGYGLAPTVGQAWEAACLETAPKNTRVVLLRTSFVLGRKGGALQTLTRLARFGLGGAVGSGKQGISWIHEHDLNQLFTRAIDHSEMNGAYIASAPQPVSNRQFMTTLRKTIGMPIGLPAFGWMVRLAAATIMNTDPELALYGRYVHSSRLAHEGFQFAFPDIDSALSNLHQSS